MDELGDLSEAMGDDFDHGYDDGKGDPNVKPKPAASPKVVTGSQTQTEFTVCFNAQEQFLTELKVQAMPGLGVSGTNPFANFNTNVGVEVIVPGEAKSATECTIKGLSPGTPYFVRLVCKNPAGTVPGKASAATLTLPAEPPAPGFLHSKATMVFIRFPEQGLGGTQVVSKLTIGVAKAGPADPFAPENKPGEMSDASPQCALLKQARIQKLQPGQLYVFRLICTNAAGSTIGAVSQPMLTMPGPPSRLREDTKLRASDSVTLKFVAHGQHLTKLTMQYAILAGKSKFEDVSSFFNLHLPCAPELLMKKSGGEVDIPDPREATQFKVPKLKGNQKYVFRLKATNASGSAYGPVLGPITTVEHAPEMLDKSGWMTLLPPENPKGKSKNSKKGGKKFWFVLDGRLLEWFTDIKGEDVDFLHLSKLQRITYVPDKDGQTKQFAMILKSGGKVTLECKSTDPNVSTHEYCMGWMSAIQKSLTAIAEPTGPKKEGRRASIQQATEDDLDDGEVIDAEGGFGDDDFDEEDGFGGFGGEDGGEDGFGGFEDDGGEDGFGGFGEGGGGFDEFEDEDDGAGVEFGGDDEFGGFE